MLQTIKETLEATLALAPVRAANALIMAHPDMSTERLAAAVAAAANERAKAVAAAIKTLRGG